MSDARYPAFDRDGQYLYFTASTNYGPGAHPLDMTSDEHEVTRSVYALVLPADAASPVAPGKRRGEAGRQRSPRKKPRRKARAPTPKPVRIDFAGMTQRIVALPIPARDYIALAAGKAGMSTSWRASRPICRPPDSRATVRFRNSI